MYRYYPKRVTNKDAADESSVRFVRYEIQIYTSHNMLYRGSQRVKLPTLIFHFGYPPPLAIFLRLQDFQRYKITDVLFWWKVFLIFGHFAASLYNPFTLEVGLVRANLKLLIQS